MFTMKSKVLSSATVSDVRRPVSIRFNISSKSCANYNWIRDNKTTTFLITPDNTRSDYVYYKNNTGLATTTVTNTMYTLVKVQIDKKTNYTKGSGTEEDPYIITTETTKKK